MIKKLFHKLAEWVTPKRVMLALAPLLIVAVMPELALAETTDAELEVYQKIGTTMSLLLNFVQSLLWPFLVFIGDLMDADLIVGPGMEESLWAIWVQLRDLVNICFVIVLLVIAFYNTLGIGGGEGNLAMKTALPKVILGVILVNFTFVAGKVVIDISNVATTAVFALPELVETFDMDAERDQFAEMVCAKPSSGEAYVVDDDSTPALTKLFCEKSEDGKTYTENLSKEAEQNYFQRLNKSNISIVMAANMGAINSQELLKPEAIDSLEDILTNLTFSLFMSLIFAISYIVLGIVLIARVVVLWIALAFSPLAVLIYVVPQLKDWLGGGGDVGQKVIKHLIAPVVIGIVMTIGYVMIDAWDARVGGATLDIAGSSSKDLFASSLLLSGVEDLAHLIIAVASIVVVWIGVFSAASDTIAGTVTDGIKGIGSSIGKAALKAPLAAATIPVSYTDDNGKRQETPLSMLDMINGARMGAANFGSDYQSQQRLSQIPAFQGLIGRGGVAATEPAKAQLRGIRGNLRGGATDGVDSDKLAQIEDYFRHLADKRVIDSGVHSQIQEEIRQIRADDGSGSFADLGRTIRNNESRFDLGDDDEARSELSGLISDLSAGNIRYTGDTSNANGGGNTGGRNNNNSGGNDNRVQRRSRNQNGGGNNNDADGDGDGGGTTNANANTNNTNGTQTPPTGTNANANVNGAANPPQGDGANNDGATNPQPADGDGDDDTTTTGQTNPPQGDGGNQ